MNGQADVLGGAFGQSRDGAEVLWCLGELQLVLLPGERTGEALSVVEHEAPQGHCPPWHRQPGDDEMFYVLEGEISFWAGDAEEAPRRAGAGSTEFIPRGTPHSFRVESATARWLTVHTPAGHERFYRASGEPGRERTVPPSAPPDMARVGAAAAENGVEMLGPPPGTSAQPAVERDS